MKKPSLSATVLVLAFALGLAVGFAVVQPQFTIYRAIYGLKYDAPSQFEAAVNLEAVTANAVNDLVKTPITDTLGDNQVSKFLADTLGSALRKPIEEKVNVAVRNAEATGRIDSPTSELPTENRDPGFGSYNFAGIESVMTNSIAGEAVLIFHSTREKHDIKVVVGLTRTSGEWLWAITSIRNLPHIVSELLEQEAKGVQRDLSKAISPDDDSDQSGKPDQTGDQNAQPSN